MIEVQIKLDNAELGHIRITKLTEGVTEFADYSCEFGVDTANGFAVYQRAVFAFPRKKVNVLGLVLAALTTLEEKELTLDGDPDAPSSSSRYASRASNLARRLRGAL